MRNSTLILALTLSVSCANVDREAVLKDVGLGPRVAPTAWQSREVIGAYVKLDIVGESHGGVVYVLDSEQCRGVLAAPGLAFDESSGFGAFLAEGRSCEVAGIGSLRELRDSRPRVRMSLNRRETARYRVVDQTEEMVLLRGDFRLAGLLGWSFAQDTLVVVERRKECEAAIASTQSAYEFRQSGPHPLLITAGGECPILGLITPAD